MRISEIPLHKYTYRLSLKELKCTWTRGATGPRILPDLHVMFFGGFLFRLAGGRAMRFPDWMRSGRGEMGWDVM